MSEKKCFKCDEVKPLSEFHKHKQMADGHLGKCKVCACKDTADYTDIKKKDPVWCFKERERGRKKQRDSRESGKAKKYSYTKNWIDMVVKKKAKSASQHMKAASGCHKHHWSYNEIHWKDIIELTKEQHYKVHRYTVYDAERLMYRTLLGVLLDTRERAVAYYDYIFDLKENEYPTQ